jgi:DNA-binding beta-propeller fold protein YncE
MAATSTLKTTKFLGILLAMSSVPATAEYEFVTAFGSFGSARGQFNEPRGIAVESGGRIVVADAANSRIQLCNENGTCSDFGSFGALTGEFDKPREVDFDFTNNEIVIADRGNDRIQLCRTTGSCDSIGGSGTGLGQFESPRGVAVLSSGQYVVADTENNRIQICTRQGSCSTFGTVGGSPGQFDGPAGLGVNSSGRIIVADRLNDRIQICTTAGSCAAFGSTGTAPGQFREPTGLAVDSQDRIIVADRLNHRVQVCTEQGNCTAFGGLGSANGQLNSPWGVGVDANDRIIVSDSGNSRIQIFAEAPAAGPVVIDSFTTSADTVQSGQQVTLNWSVRNADSCSPTGGTGGWSAQSIDPAGGSASILIAAVGVYTFTLQCTGGGATDSKSVSVTATEPPPAFLINAGITDAWYDPATSGQGFFIIVWENIRAVFMAWFTYDLERPPEDITAVLGEPGHRWITAQGEFAGDTAALQINVSSGGVFDSDQPPVVTSPDGTMEVRFTSCTQGVVNYHIDSLGISGGVPIQRIVTDNVPLCEALSE